MGVLIDFVNNLELIFHALFKSKLKKLLTAVSPELLIWIGGMILLALYPFESQHFTICPIKNAGLPFCPGCGLGMSIHNLFHLDFLDSFTAHPLGIFAFIIISWRILTLLKTSLTHYSFFYGRNTNG